jgi:hypothetical protein
MPSLTLPVGLAISSLLFCTPSSAQKPVSKARPQAVRQRAYKSGRCKCAW